MTSSTPPGWEPEAWKALERSATQPAPLDALEAPATTGTPPQPISDPAVQALCLRYDVVTLDALVLAMQAHIERLQSMLGGK